MPVHGFTKVGHRRPETFTLAEGRDTASLAEDVRTGLGAARKTLSCRYFYDEIGSRRFDQICDLPEYYLTRTEAAILRAHASTMVAGWPKSPAMIELGSGSSTKTRGLIEAARQTYLDELQYIPIDVSPTILESSAHALAEEFPGLRVTGYVADYRTALALLAARVRRPKLVVFLGSSLGNYAKDEAAALLASIAATMRTSDRLLLGVDLIKDAKILEAAYDDAQGVTAQFNLNLLARINRELGADFRLDRFAHQARYRPEHERVEMHLVSLADQTVRIPKADLAVRFDRGESIHTENSHKYSISSLHEIATRSGFVEETAWTDVHNWFRVQRWRPAH